MIINELKKYLKNCTLKLVVGGNAISVHNHIHAG